MLVLLARLALASVILLATSAVSLEQCAHGNDDASSLLQSSKGVTTAQPEADLELIDISKKSGFQSHIPRESALPSTDTEVASSDVEPSVISEHSAVQHHIQHEPEPLSTDAKVNTTLRDHIVNEIEFELNSPDGAGPIKNKVILVLLEAFILPACCGIDRCYMGQPLMGVLKAATFAGLGVWGVLDYGVVIISALKEESSINSFGFHADFGDHHQVMTAGYFSYVMFGFMICFGCCSVCIGGVLSRAADHHWWDDLPSLSSVTIFK